MKNNLTFCDAQFVEENISNFQKFKERYIEFITGRRNVNDDDNELERLGTLIDVELILNEVLFSLKEDNPERLEDQNK